MQRAAEGILEGLREAVAHKEGQNKNVRITDVVISPIPSLTPKEIRDIRVEAKLSQRVLAEALGVSAKAVEAWESGKNEPQGSSARLLALLREEPGFFEKHHVISRESEHRAEG